MARKRRSREFKNSQVIDIAAAREERRQRRALASAKKQQKEKRHKEEPSKRRAVKLARRRIVYGLIFIIISVIIGFAVFNLISLKIEEANAIAELEALKEERDRLEEELSHIDSDEYIEQQARRELRMILPGETLYVLKNKEDDESND